MFELPDISEVVALALAEDLGVRADDLLGGVPVGPELLARDATTDATVGSDTHFQGTVVARQDCGVCGLPAAAEVFATLGRAAGLFEPVEFFPLVAEGSRVRAGTAIAEVDGLASVILAAERTALDLLMVLSGIATETARWVEAAAGRFDVCDTRKTLPALRDLSKYAVRVGGGTNHRFGLHDMILIKDNHRAHAGGITAAVGRARLRHPELVIEVEADTVRQAVEAVEAGADLVLLDNMERATLAEAVAACRAAERRTGRRVALELSGNVRFERLEELRDSGIDRVSSSALTLVAPVDFALDSP
jgi:nicotinate-nucleotide pyrophosphorylase (carboxylating)